ncbi:hypothetical protein WQ90_03845 [Escherichia coli]|nr:hypothetical protein [Escherichia coli]KNG13570.1 hypothetical protein WQ90_03845 [Escherichia coli]
MVAGPVRWWKKLDFVATDNHYHFRGSFPAIRAVTGRRTRAFSLFMKIFREKADPFFFFLTD